MIVEDIRQYAGHLNPRARGHALHGLATAYIRKQEWRKAEIALVELLRVQPGEASYLASLGSVIFRGSPDSKEGLRQAAAYLKEALQEDQELSFAYQVLGEIAFHEGEVGEALRWWRTCLERDPVNVEAQRGIRLINTRTKKRGDSLVDRVRRVLSTPRGGPSGVTVTKDRSRQAVRR